MTFPLLCFSLRASSISLHVSRTESIDGGCKNSRFIVGHTYLHTWPCSVGERDGHEVDWSNQLPAHFEKVHRQCKCEVVCDLA